MFTFLQNLTIDRVSFWLGFLAGGLFLWFFGRLRTHLPQAIRSSRQRMRKLREEMSSGSEERFRHEVNLVAQRQHLAAMMFSLDEVLIPPALLAPPPAVKPESEGDEEQDVYRLTLPYLPDWPEFGSYFGAPTLTLAEALSGGANLVLLGNPGSGKTVALAQLASQLAHRDPGLGELHSFLPVFVHAADLPLSEKDTKDSLDVVTEALMARVSPLTAARLPVVLKNAFDSERVLLLLDGLDEFPQHQVEPVVTWLDALLKRFPETRVVAAASHEYYDGLARLGLFPVAMSSWTLAQRKEFTQRWGDLWHKHILRGHATPEVVDPLLLNSWLSSADIQSTPLEFTLKVWAAYAGDTLGSTSGDAIEAYVRRLSLNIPKARQVLEKLAAHSILTMSPALDIREAEKWVPESGVSVSPFDQITDLAEVTGPDLEAGEAATASETAISGQEPKPKKDGKKPQLPPAQRVLPDLIFNGLLNERRSGAISFVHPLVAGYLSSAVLSSSGDEVRLVEQPDWAGKLTALRYLSGCAEMAAIILPMIEDRQDPTYRKTNHVWHWIVEAPKNARWRSAAMRKMAGVMQQENHPLAFRMRAMTAMALSGDPGSVVLFKQMLSHHHESVRQIAVLGLGMARDAKLLNDIAAYLGDPKEAVARAAVLALASFGTKPALAFVADTLLTGSEELRRAAAEAFAAEPEEGHQVLRDGIEMEDLLVRRAVVYGLQRVRQPWATEILQKVQIEDGQWVVRSAATQALEELSGLNAHIPQVRPALADTPWLITFAGTQGEGITPSTSVDMLLKALKLGEFGHRMAALEYLGLSGDADSAPHIYHLLYGSDPDLRENAFQALWSLSSAGIPLPPPNQFGLGEY